MAVFPIIPFPRDLGIFPPFPFIFSPIIIPLAMLYFTSNVICGVPFFSFCREPFSFFTFLFLTSWIWV
jgi:hypothetical protein